MTDFNFKFTPWPWRLGKRGKYKQHFNGVGWEELGSCYVACNVDGDITATEIEEEKANARLIASAPEMAELLVECYEFFKYKDYDTRADDIHALLKRIEG